MHELSIAYQLVEIAEAAARQAGAKQVEAVHLRLGALSGVVEDSLRFAYDVATEGTLLAGSRLEVENLPVVVHCEACGADTPLESIQRFACAACGAATAELKGGRELEIVYLEISHAAETP